MSTSLREGVTNTPGMSTANPRIDIEALLKRLRTYAPKLHAGAITPHRKAMWDDINVAADLLMQPKHLTGPIQQEIDRLTELERTGRVQEDAREIHSGEIVGLSRALELIEEATP